MCLDAYVDILPAAKRLVISKRRIVRGMGQTIVAALRKALRPEPRGDLPSLEQKAQGFLESMMGHHGGRPVDIDNFANNNAHQQLLVN